MTTMRCLAVRLILLTAALFAPLAARAEAEHEKRIALVVGISAYQNAPHLANPVNDARAIGDALRRLNFDVTELYDPNLWQLNEGIRSFGIRATAADVAVVYYAGHGVQVDRENFLLPSDVKLERERDLLYEAVPLDRLLGEVSQAAHVGIVLLDSCRNNPFINNRLSRSMFVAGRGVTTTPGLARVDNVPRNTMVVMAAKADQIAEDGIDHSPFAAALLAHFQIPGLELSLFFRSVRDTVLRATHNRQEPYVFSSLGAEPFYFNPRPPNRPPSLAAITPLQLAEGAAATPLGIPLPTDPDQDPLTIRIIGMPRYGEVRIEGKPVGLNAVVTAEQFKTATYKPEGKAIGPVGSLEILVEDGRGGSVTGSLPIAVQSTHHPPVLGAPGRVQVAQEFLNIPAPVSPDNDPLIVTVTALPRGIVRNGGTILRVGDQITPAQLSGLTYWPEAGLSGPAGSLRYTVDNGHGGVTEGSTEIDVAASSSASTSSTENALWQRLHDNKDPAEFAAFLQLFPRSTHADEARRRLAELSPVATGPAPSPAVAPQPPPSARPAEPTVTALAVPTTPTPPRGPGGGNTFQDCPTCPQMVRVPAGSFVMGQGSREPESQPAHRVEIKAFALGQYPVTVGEWKACMAAKGCNFLPNMRVADDRTPIHNLSWDDAGQYVSWLSSVSGHPYRLPSEAEWEYAARGGTTTKYWWGEQQGVGLANCADCGGTEDPYGPAPVDSTRPNPFGLYDILGGVAQWTADCWFPNYRGAPANATPREGKYCEKRVLRGGSFRAPHDEITVTYRGNYDAPVRYLVNGFRVARDSE